MKKITYSKEKRVIPVSKHGKLLTTITLKPLPKKVQELFHKGIYKYGE